MSSSTDYMQNIVKEELVDSLWREFELSSYYKTGMVAVSQKNPLIVNKEKEGLREIIEDYKNVIISEEGYFERLKEREREDWFTEWKAMHNNLFKRVFKETGNWRNKEKIFHQMYDNPHKIPHPSQIVPELSELIEDIKVWLSNVEDNIRDKSIILAKIHYRFVRIHPFNDGNGRIARLITDQIGICLGLTIATSGYPRHSKLDRQEYHNAINGCVGDLDCIELSRWIEKYITTTSDQIIG